MLTNAGKSDTMYLTIEKQLTNGEYNENYKKTNSELCKEKRTY